MGHESPRQTLILTLDQRSRGPDCTSEGGTVASNLRRQMRNQRSQSRPNPSTPQLTDQGGAAAPNDEGITGDGHIGV
jgi:hypothetical protein